MIFSLAATSVLLLHLGFIFFALAGGALALWWHWVPFVHIPAAVWGVYVELTARICPLTYLENYLRIKAGQSGYTDSFIEHYLLDLIYPPGLTSEIQFLLAAFVLVINMAIYSWLFYRWRKRA